MFLNLFQYFSNDVNLPVSRYSPQATIFKRTKRQSSFFSPLLELPGLISRNNILQRVIVMITQAVHLEFVCAHEFSCRICNACWKNSPFLCALGNIKCFSFGAISLYYFVDTECYPQIREAREHKIVCTTRRRLLEIYMYISGHM